MVEAMRHSFLVLRCGPTLSMKLGAAPSLAYMGLASPGSSLKSSSSSVVNGRTA